MTHSVRILRTTLTAVLLCASLAVSAFALPYGIGTVTASSLRLRAAASTSSATLTTASRGSTVTVLENQVNGWYKVEVNGTTGYMSADYLTVSVQAQPEPVTATLNTNGSNLNLRSGPGTGYGKLASIPATTTLTITGSDNGWYKTSYNGIEGYVSSDYVILSQESSQAPENNSQPPEENSQPPADTSFTVKTGVLNTNGSNLNLRSGPGTGYSKLASIPASAKLTITGSDNGWYKTSYSGIEGYVSSDYITLTEESSQIPTAPSQPPAENTQPPETPSQPPESSVPDANATLAAQLIAYAKQFLNVPYVYGASGPNSFDCSGFTSYVFKHFGYSLNRSAADQYSNGTVVEESQMQPGDLILWRAYGSSKIATHVGIYIGNNQYIHASSTYGKVMLETINRNSTARYIVGVRRVLF